jgi:hypothetical protein
MAGDWAWLAIAASTFILRRALSADRGSVVSSLTLTPGERVLITVRSHDEPIGETIELSAEDLASLG